MDGMGFGFEFKDEIKRYGMNYEITRKTQTIVNGKPQITVSKFMLWMLVHNVKAEKFGENIEGANVGNLAKARVIKSDGALNKGDEFNFNGDNYRVEYPRQIQGNNCDFVPYFCSRIKVN